MKKTAILFPGQGSQYLGMGKAFIEADPAAAALMEMAEAISGFPLRKLCFDGPLEDLTRVLHLQPALTAVNLICWQQLQKALPDFTPAWLGGHSLGEYSALHAAEVLFAEDTIALVTKRGEFMERESAAHPGGMRAVLGLTIEEIEDLLTSYFGLGTVVVANHNSSQQIIISGDQEGLENFSEICKNAGAKKIVPLKVAGANHSPLVAGAVSDFAACMEQTTFHSPKIPLLFNVTAAPESNPAAIRAIMASQIASRVRWHESICRMIADGVEVFVELGPSSVLTGMMKKILPAGSPVVCVQADSPELLVKAVQIIQSN
ncbi:MAG: [acyl-carrier-protein] S-malonyltransferase [Candidatus Electronema aureum]|uniref:Malonyl CoA-acyl carrier protein transacylase n=1 Tax=Candidatus Electronema aureum TaxID=2005002 RepID=A0A521G4H1_9BACT|nr:MAG: [acyl-carrier-protein] S-malonyltransferase [Candidatus Electronema aureum]